MLETHFKIASLGFVNPINLVFILQFYDTWEVVCPNFSSLDRRTHQILFTIYWTIKLNAYHWSWQFQIIITCTTLTNNCQWYHKLLYAISFYLSRLSRTLLVKGLLIYCILELYSNDFNLRPISMHFLRICIFILTLIWQLATAYPPLSFTSVYGECAKECPRLCSSKKPYTRAIIRRLTIYCEFSIIAAPLVTHSIEFCNDCARPTTIITTTTLTVPSLKHRCNTWNTAHSWPMAMKWRAPWYCVYFIAKNPLRLIADGRKKIII